MSRKKGLIIVVVAISLLVLLYVYKIDNELKHKRDAISELDEQILSLENQLVESKEAYDTLEIEANNTLSDLEAMIQEYEEMNKRQLRLNHEFPSLSSFVSEFFMAQQDGDIEKLKLLVIKELIIYEDVDVYLRKGDNEKYVLLDRTRGIVTKGMAIMGYGYLEDKDAYAVHVQKFIYYEDGRPFVPASFTDFIIKRRQGGGWIIIDMSFDV